MKHIVLILAVLILIACDQEHKNYKEYYPSGSIKAEEKHIDDSTSIRTTYFENGVRELVLKYVNNKAEGEAIEYYESGELYCEMNFNEDKLNGLTKFYYKDNSVKAINLYQSGRLFFIQSITHEEKDTTEKILPIVNLYPATNYLLDTTFIEVSIPFSKYFPYSDSELFVHYDILMLEEGNEYPLPRKTNIKLSSERDKIIIPFIPTSEGEYTFQGLITIDNEPLEHYNQHFFQISFQVINE